MAESKPSIAELAELVVVVRQACEALERVAESVPSGRTFLVSVGIRVNGRLCEAIRMRNAADGCEAIAKAVSEARRAITVCLEGAGVPFMGLLVGASDETIERLHEMANQMTSLETRARMASQAVRSSSVSGATVMA